MLVHTTSFDNFRQFFFRARFTNYIIFDNRRSTIIP